MVEVAICAIASTIKISHSSVNINSNTALVNGGGMYVDQSTKIYLLKQILETLAKFKFCLPSMQTQHNIWGRNIYRGQYS